MSLLMKKVTKSVAWSFTIETTQPLGSKFPLICFVEPLLPLIQKNTTRNLQLLEEAYLLL